MIITDKQNDIFLTFAQNIDYEYTLEPTQWDDEAVLTCTNKLWILSKNKKPEDQCSCKRSPDIWDLDICMMFGINQKTSYLYLVKYINQCPSHRLQ